MKIEQTPIQRTLGLVRMLADNRDFDLGKVKREWDHAFVESELAWFREYWDSNEEAKLAAIEEADELRARVEELEREVEHRSQLAWNRLSDAEKDAAIRMG